MLEESLYLFGVIAVCWAIIFILRAVPFIFFGSLKKPIPAKVELFFGNVLSPIIIAAIIVWAYSSLNYKSFSPYLAGALTIGLHLWRRNALLSVIVGTLAYMTLVNLCGCSSQRIVVLDKENPSIHVTNLGIKIDDNFVEEHEVAKLLIDNDIPKTRVIHILVDDDLRELRTSRNLMGSLCAAGYSRPVLVTKQHADAVVSDKPKRPQPMGGFNSDRSSSSSKKAKKSAQNSKPRKIRYKKAHE